MPINTLVMENTTNTKKRDERKMKSLDFRNEGKRGNWHDHCPSPFFQHKKPFQTKAKAAHSRYIGLGSGSSGYSYPRAFDKKNRKRPHRNEYKQISVFAK